MLSPPERPGLFRFSTSGIPTRERRKAVCELRERGILPIEPLRDAAVSLRIAKRFLPGASILSGTLSGLRQEGSPHSVNADDDLFLGVNLSGRSTAAQRGSEITFGDGDAILLSCAEAAFAIIRPTPAQFVGLRVPRRAIARLVPDLDDRVMRVIPAETPPLRLLTTYLYAIPDDQASDSTEMSRLVATHLHDLIALSLGTGPDGEADADRSVRAARLEAIKSDILDNLGEALITVSHIAARHHVTPRYVHKLFETEGITFTQFILDRRLDRAYRSLRDLRFANRSITSIAYDAGFGDLSYFNRTFRRHYGATPSDIRNSTRD
jgi:AraC-like DNA-binding protein